MPASPTVKWRFKPASPVAPFAIGARAEVSCAIAEEAQTINARIFRARPLALQSERSRDAWTFPCGRDTGRVSSPQHGRGVKHERRIRLTGWQTELVERHRPALLRGLIHSDGCRIIAREKSGSGLREAPRYLFSNRSEDIKELFCNSCDALGIRWTRPSDIQIAIYRKASVAILDDFVGPKT